MATRRRFTQEYKDQAVSLHLDSGRSITEVGLMKAVGLRGRHPRAWKKTTVAGQRPIDAPDLIGQDFTAAEPNIRWCGDITY